MSLAYLIRPPGYASHIEAPDTPTGDAPGDDYEPHETPASEVAQREPSPAGPPHAPMLVQRTRTASLFAMAALGLVLALLMLVFVLQNGDSQEYEFLWADFTLPAGVATLLAAIVGGLVVASLGLGRVVQLRLAARRHRSADRRTA